MTIESRILTDLPNRADDQLKPLWEYSDEELHMLRVTEFSTFLDHTWERKPTTAGQRESIGRLNWGIELFDGTRLTDPQNSRRLLWARKLMAVLLKAPSDCFGPAVASTGSFRRGFQWLLSWMSNHGYHHPHELTPDVVSHYLEDLPRILLDHQESEGISGSQAALGLKILTCLWTERRVLTLWGVPSMPVNPFGTKSAGSHAKQIATKTRGWIQPLPDEVAIPMFNKAAWFLNTPAEDVIQLLDVVRDPIADSDCIEVVVVMKGKEHIRRRKPGKRPAPRQRRAKKFLDSFQFSTLPGDTHPWHPPLNENYEASRGMTPTARVRQLFEAVREACAINIQGTTGMRISELMGIKAGLDPVTDLPLGVRIESSATGLYDVYLIRTELAKTEKGLPREVDWVLGLRPKDSTEEPLAVRALRLLNRLYEPWRPWANTSRLFIMDTGGETFRLKTTSQSAMTSQTMTGGMKRFFERWVDLSGLPDESKHKIRDNDLVAWRESKGTIFTTHMLRKSWAQYVFAVDPALAPAIQLQFHHLSLAMTDTGYIGSNPLLMTSMNQVAEQQRNLMVFETIMGRSPIAGKMGEQIERATRGLTEDFKNLPISEAWQRTVEFCDEQGLTIFFSPYATCLPIHTSTMRCHDEAHTPVGLRLKPNYATRESSLCAGCDNFAIDYRHIPFWQERYLQNWITYKQAEKRGETSGGQFRVFLDRAQQAGKLLKKVGADMKALERQVKMTLKEDHALARVH
ncbi:hypothetical protein [Thiobacillus denitrificans]|uniref:hypothetical protein n=1 Tax=Thiobacillus denitrificans TaxID=36861 RepID=UPI000373612D|nr:hypothetical protein [Thiobacillus denitrificans]